MTGTDQLNNLKIIVFDLDGTLLADDATIGKKTKELVYELQKRDVRFSFASGRLHSAITSFAEELKIKTPLVSLDGCLIKSYPDGEVLFESFVKEKHVRRAINYAEQFLINISLCHDNAIYYTDNNSLIPQIVEKFGAKYEMVSSYNNYLDRTLEVVLAGDNREAIKYILDRLSIPYCFGLNTSYFRSQTYEGIYYLELRRKGSSKATGMLRLLKRLKIKPHEAAVIGDWYNDISLFQTSALKVALANAVPELKRMADIITKKDNNNDGTAEFLEMVLNAKGHV